MCLKLSDKCSVEDIALNPSLRKSKREGIILILDASYSFRCRATLHYIDNAVICIA